MLVLRERKAARNRWPADLRSEISDLKSLAESCSRQIRAWADQLQNSEIRGQRHLNDVTRSADDRKKRVDSVEERLLASLAPDHPLRKAAEERMRTRSETI